MCVCVFCMPLEFYDGGNLHSTAVLLEVEAVVVVYPLSRNKLFSSTNKRFP